MAPTILLYAYIHIIVVIVIIAAGNEGASGAFTAGTPSVGHGPVSVASFDNNYFIAKQFSADGLDGKQSEYISTKPKS